MYPFIATSIPRDPHLRPSPIQKEPPKKSQGSLTQGAMELATNSQRPNLFTAKQTHEGEPDANDPHQVQPALLNSLKRKCEPDTINLSEITADTTSHGGKNGLPGPEKKNGKKNNSKSCNLNQSV